MTMHKQVFGLKSLGLEEASSRPPALVVWSLGTARLLFLMEIATVYPAWTTMTTCPRLFLATMHPVCHSAPQLERLITYWFSGTPAIVLFRSLSHKWEDKSSVHRWNEMFALFSTFWFFVLWIHCREGQSPHSLLVPCRIYLFLISSTSKKLKPSSASCRLGYPNYRTSIGENTTRVHVSFLSLDFDWLPHLDASLIFLLTPQEPSIKNVRKNLLFDVFLLFVERRQIWTEISHNEHWWEAFHFIRLKIAIQKARKQLHI